MSGVDLSQRVDGKYRIPPKRTGCPRKRRGGYVVENWKTWPRRDDRGGVAEKTRKRPTYLE